MKQNLKNYHFCDFNFKQELPCVKKNELSIQRHYNLKINEKTIKPVAAHVDFFYDKFDEDDVNQLFEKYPDFKNQFLFLTFYEYFDENFKEDKCVIFAISNSLELYQISMEDLTISTLGFTFSNLPKCFLNNNKIYFYSKGDKLIYFDKTNSFIVSNFVDLIDFATFQDKVFFVVNSDPSSIYYTDKMEIEEIDETLVQYDKLTMPENRGKILRLVHFKGGLYVVQQYAISKLTGTERNYYFTANCNISSRIYNNTLSKVNDYIIFYTSSGLFLFDGNEVKHIFEHLAGSVIVDDETQGLVFNDKYYLLADFKQEDKIFRNLLEFDIYTNHFCNYYIKGVENIYVITSPSCYELILVLRDNNSIQLFNLKPNSFTNDNMFLKFNDITFDDSSLKHISALKIIASGEFDLKISTEKGTKTLHVKNNLEIDNLGIFGFVFQIQIFSDTFFELKSILFSIETIE